jgi:uncharacterized delta-60 repeat protein
MRRTRCRAVALAMLLLPAIARARPGDLDPTWSGDGIATTDLGSASDTPDTLALQSDGKVVVVGGFGAQYVVRYRVDGTLDTDFGSGGIVVTNPSGTCSQPFAKAVAIDAGGRIVVAADLSSCNAWLVARYDGTGALDATFGTGGLAVLPTASDSNVEGLLIQPDGRIVVAGFRRNADPDILLIRLNDDGAADATFGVGGYVDTDLTSDDEGFGVARRTDGTLIVLALTDLGPTVMRYDTSGSLDPSFGTGGLATVAVPELTKLALEPDDRILLAGRTVVAPTDVLTVRLEPDGALDTTFGGTGIVSTVLGGPLHNTPTGLVVQPDGKIVVSAHSDRPGNIHDVVLLRFLDGGLLDATFGLGGIVRTLVGGTFLVANGGIAIQGDGKLVVAGATGPFSSLDFAVYRYLGGTCGDGVLDGGEGCDDGDAIASACCSGLCEAAPAGTACEEDVAPCHTDDRCDGAGTCDHVGAPLAGCRQAIAPGSGRLTAKASPPTLAWKWTRGASTTISEFADPLTDDAYALCAYAGPGETEVVSALAPAGGACGGRPCWTLRGAAGFRYRDRLRSGNGLEKIVLTAGGDGSAKAVVKAKGAHLALPALPFALPLRVQLQSTNGNCWEGTFSAAGTSINDTIRFVGRSD